MFENKLPTLADFDVIKAHYAPRDVTIEIEARRCLLSDNPKVAPTKRNAWRYIREGSKEDLPGVLPVPLGPVFDVRRGMQVKVTWVDELGSQPPEMDGKFSTLEMPPVNPVDMNFNEKFWKKMNSSVGVVTHLHGAKVEAKSDGWPLKPASFAGNSYSFGTSLVTTYANDQRAAMLWFHDHGMDNTSPQVHAGLAGLYLVRDDSDDALFGLIGGKDNEVPLVIQDRKFDCGFDRVNFWAGVPTLVDGPDPADPSKTLMKFDRPEFLGDTIVVNGRPSPFVMLPRKVYRLRILNGSNARTYALALIDPAGWAMMGMNMDARVWYSDLMTVIGNDGGLMPESHKAGPTDHILLAPGERLDVLLDLTSLADMMPSRLRLVNLALGPAQAGGGAEGIYQTTEAQDFGPPILAAPSSLIAETPTAATAATDTKALATIGAMSCANILEICIDASTPAAQPMSTYQAQIDAILAGKASEDGFTWMPKTAATPGKYLAPATIAANRLVVLMNNTRKVEGAPGYAGGVWRDTQIWEMSKTRPAKPAGYNPLPFAIPFDIDTGAPAAPMDYFVTRWSFFKDYPAAKRIDIDGQFDVLCGDDGDGNVIQPQQGTYERWYVANLSNEYDDTTRVLSAGSGGDATTAPTIPDMHPFHMHLVNFVVTNRWRLGAKTKAFGPWTRPLDFDGACRHDTVRVEANELLELLVYFPPGYKGKYPYHCHIVEHEDMGMMSHFEVV